MADIWSGIGVEIKSSEGDWLYRAGPEVRGPVPFNAVVSKLLAGEIGLDTQVAKEGGDFHPISTVAAFAPHYKKAQQQLAAKKAAVVRRIVAVVLLVAAAGLGGAGFFFWQELERKKAETVAEQLRLEAEREAKRKAHEAAPQMALVALVSLGTEEDVKIRQEPKPAGSGKKPGTSGKRPDAAKPGAPPPAVTEPQVMDCTLSQADIFNTLKKHLAKLNVCVEDEKSRDKEGLLPSTLSLEFVVRPDGKVVEFAIDDRHYRKGPMNNCMIKAFTTIAFPTSTGSNCPVTIPIKIGGK